MDILTWSHQPTRNCFKDVSLLSASPPPGHENAMLGGHSHRRSSIDILRKALPWLSPQLQVVVEEWVMVVWLWLR